MTGPANVISLSAVRFSPESPEILRCAQNDKEEARNSRPNRQTFSLSTYRAPPHPPAGQSLRCAQNDKEEARNSRPNRQTFSLSTYRAPPHPPAGQSLRCAQNDVRRAGMMWRKLGMTQGGALEITRRALRMPNRKPQCQGARSVCRSRESAQAEQSPADTTKTQDDKNERSEYPKHALRPTELEP